MSKREHALRRILAKSLPILERTLSEEQISLFQAKAEEQFAALEPDAPEFSERVDRSLFLLGVPLLALYRALRSDLAMDQESALSVLRDMLEATYGRQFTSFSGRTLINLSLLPIIRVGPIRDLGIRKLTAANEPLGFRFEQAQDDSALLAFDVRDCALVRYAKAHNASELVPLICELDEVMAESLIGVTLKRTGTIGLGAERCDFRYVKSSD